MVSINKSLKGYNELQKATIRSIKSEKSDRKAIRKYNEKEHLRLFKRIKRVSEETQEQQRKAKAEKEAFLKADREFWIENDRRKAENERHIKKKRAKAEAILLSKIKNLKTGSYKISDEDWKSYSYDKGFMVARTEFKGVLDFKDFEFLGVWVDEKKDNRLWVDYSVWVENKEKALELGKLWGQKAVYDCKNRVDVRLDDNF